MLVKDVMKRPVITIGPEATLHEAHRLMWEKGIRHLPVVDARGELVGILTDRDIRLATSNLRENPLPCDAKVYEVMTRPVLTADPLDPVEDAARLMREEKIGCLPVLEGKDLVGILTGIDLLDALIVLTGATRPAGRIEVLLPDRPGELTRLTAFFAEKKINIHSVLTYPVADDRVMNVLRVETLEVRPLAEELRARGFEVVWPPEKPWSR